MSRHEQILNAALNDDQLVSQRSDARISRGQRPGPLVDLLSTLAQHGNEFGDDGVKNALQTDNWDDNTLVFRLFHTDHKNWREKAESAFLPVTQAKNYKFEITIEEMVTVFQSYRRSQRDIHEYQLEVHFTGPEHHRVVPNIFRGRAGPSHGHEKSGHVAGGQGSSTQAGS
ncbi:MAG: hypothetical protein Q9159_004142 [Coniocarpon cinnabarinum]